MLTLFETPGAAILIGPLLLSCSLNMDDSYGLWFWFTVGFYLSYYIRKGDKFSIRILWSLKIGHDLAGFRPGICQDVCTCVPNPID